MDDLRWNSLKSKEFWEQVNKPWLDEAIERGDEIYVASSGTPRPYSFFERGIRYLESKGFVRAGDYMIKQK